LRYEIALVFCYLLINNTILATSVIMEAKRKSDELPFELWEPFVWEYASAITTFFLIFAVAWLLKKYPFDFAAIKRSLLFYILMSIAYSLVHTAGMVAIKELVYTLLSRNYDFGDFWFELFYEYRKDLWGFIFIIVMIKCYDFIVSRLQGEANPIADGEDKEVPANLDRLLVKKLGKEFIIRVDDIEWLEAAGNYVNLHINERIYPMRATLTALNKQLSNRGFCRIHRSFAINLNEIESITPLSSGDSEVRLNSGKVLNLSRRYKEEFKNLLQAT